MRYLEAKDAVLIVLVGGCGGGTNMSDAAKNPPQQTGTDMPHAGSDQRNAA